MNKQKQLTKKLIKSGVISGIIIAVVAGLYVGAMMYGDSVAKGKTDAESDYSSDNTRLSNLRTQIDTSDSAEKRFATIQADHPNGDADHPYGNYDADLTTPGGLNDFLRNAKDRYHFGKLTLKPVKEVTSDKSTLANFSHEVRIRPRLQIQITAVSDVHVFSFIDSLRREAPGFVRIDKLQLKRVADMTPEALKKIPEGTTPLLVEATIEFSWIRIVPKEKKDAKPGDAAAPAAAPPPAAPAT